MKLELFLLYSCSIDTVKDESKQWSGLQSVPIFFIILYINFIIGFSSESLYLIHPNLSFYFRSFETVHRQSRRKQDQKYKLYRTHMALVALVVSDERYNLFDYVDNLRIEPWRRYGQSARGGDVDSWPNLHAT